MSEFTPGLVSVIIPAYNHEQFVGRAVESVLAQTYSQVECIAVDDGSTDGTAAVLESYADKGVRCIRQENQGSAAAINAGLEQATGEFRTILNSDDAYHPERLERLAGHLREHPDCDLCFTRTRFVDADDAPLVEGAVVKWLREGYEYFRAGHSLAAGVLYRNFSMTTSNYFFRASLLSRTGPFEDLRYITDLHFLLRAVEHGGVDFLDLPLLDYRRHGDNTIDESVGLRKRQFELEMAWLLAGVQQRPGLLRKMSPEELSYLVGDEQGDRSKLVHLFAALMQREPERPSIEFLADPVVRKRAESLFAEETDTAHAEEEPPSPAESAPEEPAPASKPDVRRVCIVTPDIVGPIKNGGIGTHCFYLAKFLASQPGYEVTVLFALDEDEGKGLTAKWQGFFAKHGITFVSAGDQEPYRYRVEGCSRFARLSSRVRDYLIDKEFDAVHFQDWRAGGFVSIQAKRVGLAFANTMLTVTMHAPHDWQNQGMEQWNTEPGHDMLLSWMERYCCEHADVVISPTQHMFDWAQANNWTLARDNRICRLCYKPEEKPAGGGVKPDHAHLVFFGRLETRKGLKVFCEAVSYALYRKPGAVKKISFLGKIGTVDGENADNYIATQFEEIEGLSWEIIDSLDTFKALEYIKESRGVVIIPSLLDNSPYTVIECIENRIPFLASRTGGIPELAHEDALFRLDAGVLSDKLLELESLQLADMDHHYSNELSESQWLALHDYATPASRRPARATPRVSVCIPHYNHQEFLPMVLESLANQDYPDLEVVVVDDGSTDPEARAVFKDLQRQYPTWKFVSIDNTGYPGQVRNEAAKHATGEYFVFVDSDNYVMENTISRMVRGILTANVDCLTCWLKSFSSLGKPQPYTVPEFAYHPMGSCKEFGGIENVYGDTNCIIKRDVFNVLGGFPLDHKGYEDWEFLARLNLKGYTQDVIPAYLLWYRVTPGSVTELHNAYECHQKVLRAYHEHDPVLSRLLSAMAVPSWKMMTGQHMGLDPHSFRGGMLFTVFFKCVGVLNRIFPRGSRRRKWAKKIGRKVIKR